MIAEMMIEIQLILALMIPRDFNCSTALPPSALCCGIIRQVRKHRHLTKEVRAVLDAYIAKQCSGAEFAQKKAPGGPGAGGGHGETE